MSDRDLEKLLGGFAADTLTPEEKQALYTAALQDQQLFNALADEQALKELLADPDIRHRLLASWEQKKPLSPSDSLSWLDWFHRPAGLAFAGGLTAAALAVVLGVRIYQDSLRQAAQSVATEASKSASPPVPMPQASQPPAPHVSEPPPKSKKDAPFDNMTTRERSVPPPSKHEGPSDVPRDGVDQRIAREEVRREANAPMAALSKSAEEVPSSEQQKLAGSSGPPAKASVPAPMQSSTGAPAAKVATPAVSARALFYAVDDAPQDPDRIVQEKEQAKKPLAESASQPNRLGRPLEGPLQPGKKTGMVAPLRPLGLRYSFVVRGVDGQEREVDAATASRITAPIFLTMESNQDAYLQVWKMAGFSTPQLHWPEKETGQLSLKMTAGHRQQIGLPTETGRVTFTAHLSRVPFGPTTEHEAAMFDRLSHNQLLESITESNQTGSHEQATYVISQDPSITAQISIGLTLNR
jgi:cytoskeletal protein RodZ